MFAAAAAHGAGYVGARMAMMAAQVELAVDVGVRRVLETLEEGFPGIEAAASLMRDVRLLYAGGWSTYEPCAVGYHTFGHVLDVSLAAARMLVGWNLTHGQQRFTEREALVALAGALFHDAGYLKDRGDTQGRGGKHAFVHVERGRRMARAHLERLGWDASRLELVDGIIAQTEFLNAPDLTGPLGAFPGRELACMVATADLVAQMADPHYLQRLTDLYEEFEEAYDQVGRENLRRRGVHVFDSAKEIHDGTLLFFEQFVVPRLDAFQRVYCALGDYFGGERNPYIESIATNLYGSTAVTLSPRQRIGELLVDLGLISEQVLTRALERQESLNHTAERDPCHDAIPGLERLVGWIDQQSGRHYLGEVLVRMGEVDGRVISQVMAEQLLPTHLEKRLPPTDLVTLLRIGMVLGSVRHMPHLYGQVLRMVIELVGCQAGSVLLADVRSSSLVIVKAVGPRGDDVQGVAIPWDKGVAGWAYANQRPAAVNHTHYDSRFFADLDARSGFATRSVLAVPLQVDDRVIGVVEVLNKQGELGVFDERDLIVLTIVAQQLAGSLDAFLWMMENGTFPLPGEPA